MKTKLLERMKLNASKEIDIEFNKSIKFIVEEFIENNIPYQYIFNNLNDAIIKSYDLFLDNKLQGISLLDSDGNCNFSNALNYFTNDLEKIKKDSEIELLNKDIELYKRFLKENKADKLFYNFKKSIK